MQNKLLLALFPKIKFFLVEQVESLRNEWVVKITMRVQVTQTRRQF